MSNTLHIRAVGDLRCPYVGPDGVPVAGRYAGRARKTFEALPDGEHVPDHSDHRRAIVRGDLELVVAKPALPVITVLASEPVDAATFAAARAAVAEAFDAMDSTEAAPDPAEPATKEHDQ